MKVVAVLFLLCCGLSGIHGEQSDIYDELRKMRIDLDNTVRDLEKLKTTYEGKEKQRTWSTAIQLFCDSQHILNESARFLHVVCSSLQKWLN